MSHATTMPRHAPACRARPRRAMTVMGDMLLLAGVAVLFQWVFPWAASTIPLLHDASGYQVF